MKKLAAIAIGILATLTTQAAVNCTLAWDFSQASNVTSYVLYYGQASGVYTAQTNVGNVGVATVSNLASGPVWFFVVTARDDAIGLESEPSNEVSTRSQIAPPGGLRIPSVTNSVGGVRLSVNVEKKTGIDGEWAWLFPCPIFLDDDHATSEVAYYRAAVGIWRD